MALKVNLYGNLRVVLGCDEVTLDWKDATLREMIAQLSARCGRSVEEELLDEAGEIDRAYVVFVRGERVDDLSTGIKDGDEVVITSMLAGG